MPENDLVLVSGVSPSWLRISSPSVQDAPESSAFDSAMPGEMQEEPEIPESVSLLHKTCSSVFSMWFTLLRRNIQAERDRQMRYKEEHSLPKSAKVQYIPPVLSEPDMAVVASLTTLVRSVFGDLPADYAKNRFDCAIATGDMRAFKIRLLVLKVRDSLSGSTIHSQFARGVDDCIAEAEALAGCIPDPSPRRMSHVEQERKKARELKAAKKAESQPELPLVWPDRVQDIENADALDDTDKSKPLLIFSQKTAKKFVPKENTNCGGVILEKKSETNQIILEKDNDDNVTVTNGEDDGSYSNVFEAKILNDEPDGKQNKKRRLTKKIKRKARDYNTVDEILEDIDAGKIEPYDSVEEICNDVKDGVITPADAFMFTAALEQYNPSDEEIDESLNSEDLEDESDEEEGINGYGEEYVEDEEDGYEEERDRRGSCVPFSYNPRGYCGCDFASDDDW